VNSVQLLPAIRDLFSRPPEMIGLGPWHLQWILFALGYTNELEDEAEIAAAAVAVMDSSGNAA
jgi:hypothetical protein